MQNHPKRIIVIGAGFAGLAAASVLAKKGFKVTILEKNDQPGGRARVWEKDGFKFDMGPSWYWMPDVFENYFSLFNHHPKDFYQLKRLDPGYRVYYGAHDYIDVPADRGQLDELFDRLEPGSSAGLKQFLDQAGYKYKVGMNEYVFRPSHSVTEFIDLNLIRKSLNMQLLTNMRKHVAKYFKNPKLVKLLEFPVLFLGATPQNTPALYSMMNYADLVLGTWYPFGGMNEIVQGMVKVAEELGVEIKLNTEVTAIDIADQQVSKIRTVSGDFEADFVVAGADYEHVDQQLLPKQKRNYTPEYWDKRVMSPSSLLFYIGTDCKIDNIQHHNLFFDEDFEKHADEIYTHPKWPEKPLFYVCCSSKTDASVAPPEGENLFFLMPLAPGLKDDEQLREKYFNIMLDRFEKLTGNKDIRQHIVVKRSYAMDDFTADYHSYKGNAYGLANTLSQTAFFKPAMRAKKVKNLLFTGQLTVPGPGVPPALISGQVAAEEAAKYFKE
ncbi:phytoene desaturase family protein [Mucilaginibacter sp. RS28]|uniref:Phytoene desaturase family protein n=1 Tax=Mucilaginibacter straminoryzae TaxID=2932774 RepID=A0A9X1X191_9SPHI|nr:phytoene desaturase family protein [Mucilaginibacter straminoryzae]MCJ8209377.1 phytoene desaturase family protein [Mucilaginibacter straminoryzae]